MHYRIMSVARRTRSVGAWFSGERFTSIELGTTIANSITRCPKDSMVVQFNVYAEGGRAEMGILVIYQETTTN